MLCKLCTATDAPRPTGTQTRTFNGITHYALECASGAAAGEQMIQTDKGYVTESGRIACDSCFYFGHPHSYEVGQEPHPPEQIRARHNLMQLMEQQLYTVDSEAPEVQLARQVLINISGGKLGRRIPYRRQPTKRGYMDRRIERARKRQADKENRDGTTRTSAQERTAARTPTQGTESGAEPDR